MLDEIAQDVEGLGRQWNDVPVAPQSRAGYLQDALSPEGECVVRHRQIVLSSSSPTITNSCTKVRARWSSTACYDGVDDRSGIDQRLTAVINPPVIHHSWLKAGSHSTLPVSSE